MRINDQMRLLCSVGSCITETTAAAESGVCG